MKIRFGSVCSGIEAASVAWQTLGWEAAWFSEIEKFPCEVLKYHYPNIVNLGDMTALPQKILNKEIEAPELLCGGTPCQSFSVAGLRQSLSDSRGNLALLFCELFHAIRFIRKERGESEPIVFWENVPGVLFTKDNAFGCFLAGLLRSDILRSGTENGSWPAAGWASCDGMHVAWRVLDAQYFGVAQRRKRVFVIASARKMDTGDIGLPQKVLFESPSVCRNIGESQKKQSDFTTFTENHFRQYVQKDQVNTLNTNRHGLEGIIAFPLDSFTGYKEGGISGTLKAGTGTIHGGGESLIAYSQKDTRCSNYQEDRISPTLKSAGGIARGNNEVLILEDHGFKNGYITDNKAYSVLTSNINYVLPQDHLKLRKLTPRECERLQGFPDDYTKIPYRGHPAEECPDGPRYRAIGNSWAVPVIRWLGRRIEKVLNNET